jgi:hypothetical protein
MIILWSIFNIGSSGFCAGAFFPLKVTPLYSPLRFRGDEGGLRREVTHSIPG